MKIKEALSAIADLALPRVCICCGCRLDSFERHICVPCLAELPETHFSERSHNPMADRLNDKIERDRAHRGLIYPESYLHASALYFYRNGLPYKYISQELKYKRNFGAGKYFSDLLASRLASSPLFANVDYVLPVPLHWTRQWKRGYNQAELIARCVADGLGCGCLTRALIRKRHTHSQAHIKGSGAKAANVAGAFAVRPSKDLQKARHLLLVDDVFTTGATLSECIIALRDALGPSVSISVATLGFVG